jgi:glutamyl-tRNA synthetase
MIEKDFTWLVGKPDEVYIQSDRINLYYKNAEKLLRKGHLYICEEEPETIRNKIRKGQSPLGKRNSIKENLSKWKLMLSGEYKSGKAVVRVKTDSRLKNPALRDWIAFRINTNAHPRVGEKYRVWPMMNFAVAVDDHKLKLTHIIRGKDHEDQTRRQQNIFKFMGWKTPEYIHLGRINFKGMNLSASEIRKGVDSGKFSGYDDSKVETLASLRKRGFKPSAIIKYFYEIGPTKRDKTVEKEDVYKTLKALNRKII